MILNAYVILAGFLATVRLPLAVFVVGLALHAWRKGRLPSAPKSAENRYYLLVLLAIVLLGFNVIAWPLLYAVLQSYVPQWPGVMCIYGVTRIGSGSQGISGYLPALIGTLQVTKPLVVFASGAWFIVYLSNRRLQKSELFSHVIVLLLAFGSISAVDAVMEVAYLTIPKSEKFLDVGCCTTALTEPGSPRRFVPSALVNESSRPWIRVAYVALNAGIPLALIACQFKIRRNWLIVPLAAALISLPVSIVYLVEIAAPTILALPYHHCPYDLLANAPETAVGIGLFLLGVLAIGWASIVDWLGRSAACQGIQRTIERLLFVSAFGYLGSLVLFRMEMVLS